MSAAADSDDGESAGIKSPLDVVLDLGVFAPLGFALEFRRLIPELVESGRRQIAFSRTLGRAALSTVARSNATSSAVRPTATAKGVGASPAIDGYDAMNARDIVALLASSTAEQVTWIGDREAAGKGRVTIMRAVERRRESL